MYLTDLVNDYLTGLNRINLTQNHFIRIFDEHFNTTRREREREEMRFWHIPGSNFIGTKRERVIRLH